MNKGKQLLSLLIIPLLLFSANIVSAKKIVIIFSHENSDIPVNIAYKQNPVSAGLMMSLIPIIATIILLLGIWQFDNIKQLYKGIKND